MAAPQIEIYLTSRHYEYSHQKFWIVDGERASERAFPDTSPSLLEHARCMRGVAYREGCGHKDTPPL